LSCNFYSPQISIEKLDEFQKVWNVKIIHLKLVPKSWVYSKYYHSMFGGSFLEVIGIPLDVIYLFRILLTDRSLYVTIDGKNSILIELVCGILQGSILGPILYAIYVSPLFDLHNLTNFANDNFNERWKMHMPDLVVVKRWVAKVPLKHL
jgi:hypothetical protein